MKTTYFNWNDSSANDLILTEVRSTPTNLASAFSRVASELNTTHQAVSSHWYRNLRKNSEGFSVKSKSSKSSNVKNDARRVKTSKEVDLSNPIYEIVVSTKKLDSMRVVTIKKYFID